MRYGNADLVFSEEYADVSRIESNVLSCSFRISEYDGEKVKVNAYSSGFPASPAPVVSQSGSVLSIRQEEILSIGIFKHNTVEVLVPRNSSFDYKLHTASGSIRLDAKSNDTNVSSSSGSVRVYQGGKTLEVKCTSGSIRVYEPFVSENVNCSSGSVRIKCGEISENANVNCTSGSIRIMLEPEDIGYVFNAKATSGSIKDEYQEASFGRSGTSSHGDQKLMINAHTTSGSIRLDDWDD